MTNEDQDHDPLEALAEYGKRDVDIQYPEPDGYRQTFEIWRKDDVHGDMVLRIVDQKKPYKAVYISIEKDHKSFNIALTKKEAEILKLILRRDQ